MAEGEVKVVFRTEADLKGAQELSVAVKQMQTQLSHVPENFTKTAEAGKKADVAVKNVAKSGAIAAGNLNVAGAQSRGFTDAISRSLNPMRMFANMVSGFTRGALFGGMAASFGAMNQEVRQLLNSMFSVVHLADTLASTWIGMGRAMAAVVQSTKDLDVKLRNIDASSRSTEQNFGRTLSIAEELLAAEERMAKVTGENAEQELDRYKRREDLLVKEAEAKATFEETKLNAEEQVLADLKKARPSGTPETSKMVADAAAKRLAEQQADLQILYQAQTGTGYDVPLGAMQATERATGGKTGVIDFVKPDLGKIPAGLNYLDILKRGASKRIEMLTEASNQIERDIQEGRLAVETATARAADIEAKDAAIKAVEGRVETSRQSRTEAYANRDFARERRKIRVESTEWVTRTAGGYSPPGARFEPKRKPNTPAEQALVDDELLRRMLVRWEKFGNEAASANEIFSQMVRVGEINAVSISTFKARVEILESRANNQR